MKHGWRSGVRAVLGGALIAGAMAGAATGAWALPKVEEVAAEVHAGHYDRAEVMMRDVLEAKPKSARAHYLYAEILAHNGRLDEARRHADQAAQLDPALGFTEPAKFRAFQARLGRDGVLTQPVPTSVANPVAMPPQAVAVEPSGHTGSAKAASGGVPGWIWVLGLAGLGYGLWRWTRRPQAVPFQTAPTTAMAHTGWPGGVAGSAGSVAGYPYPPQQGVPGQGSGLSTGMAVAGGVVGGVALGMLAEHMMHGSSSSAASNASATDQGHAAGASSGLAGGAEPGFFSPSGPGYAEPEMDFGTGNEWGDDGGGSGGDGGGGDGW